MVDSIDCVKAKKELQRIYKTHNRDKLKDIDQLLEKYKGREDDLVKAVCALYRPSRYFVLKRQPKKRNGGEQEQYWNYQEQFASIQPELNLHAASVGGTLKLPSMRRPTDDCFVWGLCLRQGYSASEAQIESTVDAMCDLVHRRMRFQPVTMANAPELGEHEKRQLEKTKSLRKGKQQNWKR
jgi:hypothetical protein